MTANTPTNRMSQTKTRSKPGRPAITEDPAWQPPQEILMGKPCSCGSPFDRLRVASGGKSGNDGITAVRYMRCPDCGKRHTLRVVTQSRNPANG
jgi:hypothetical protein